MAFFEDFEQRKKDQAYPKRCAILSGSLFTYTGIFLVGRSYLYLHAVFLETTEKCFKTHVKGFFSVAENCRDLESCYFAVKSLSVSIQLITAVCPNTVVTYQKHVFLHHI